MDDDWLMRRIAAGDPRAFEDIVRRYEPSLGRFAARLLGGDIDRAADVVQEVFLRLWRSASTYDGCGKLSAYLFRMTYTTGIDMRRSIKAVVDMDDVVDQAAVDDTEGDATRGAFVHAVGLAVDDLPDEQRLVFVLGLEGLSYAEIAEIARCPVGTVASRKRLAVAALRARLADWREV